MQTSDGMYGWDLSSELDRMSDVSQTSLWEKMAFFGLPLVDDETPYSDSNEFVELELISLDNPPRLVPMALQEVD